MFRQSFAIATVVLTLTGTLVLADDASSSIDQPSEVLPEQIIDNWSDGGDVGVEATSEGTVVSFAGAESALDMRVPDVFVHTTESDGFLVTSTDDQLASVYTRSSDIGGQVIFVATSEDYLDSFEVVLDAEVVDQASLPDGQLGLAFEDGTGIVLNAPWAYDARGISLPTRLEIEGNRVTQIVETAGAEFPVTADPAWTYTQWYMINKTPAVVKQKLTATGKFNKLFPVAGAPANFPSKDKFLPLTVGAWNFNCYMNGTFSGSDSSGNWWGYSFRAAASHVDGAGSSIKFTFERSYGTGATKLWVYAYIVNSMPTGLPRMYYVDGAAANWGNFARNINNS